MAAKEVLPLPRRRGFVKMCLRHWGDEAAATSAASVAGSVAIAADALGSVVLGSGGFEGSGEGSGVGSRAPSPRFGRLLAGRTLGCNLSIDELR